MFCLEVEFEGFIAFYGLKFRFERAVSTLFRLGMYWNFHLDCFIFVCFDIITVLVVIGSSSVSNDSSESFVTSYFLITILIG